MGEEGGKKATFSLTEDVKSLFRRSVLKEVCKCKASVLQPRGGEEQRGGEAVMLSGRFQASAGNVEGPGPSSTVSSALLLVKDGGAFLERSH